MIENREAHVDEVKQAISERLRPICTNMSEKEFQHMIDQLTEITLEYEVTSEPPSLRSARQSP